MLNDIGSGSVTLNMDAPWWKNTAMGDGSTANTILDFECLWQIALDGVVRFEFLGETITEQLVDPSEQRMVTVTGPGTAATLKWAAAMPQGFPAIVLKLDGIVDTFGEISSSGSGVLDTNIWNVVSPAGSAYITPVPQAATQAPGVVTSASGTLTIAATAGTTLLGSTPWDATDTLISAQIRPVGVAGQRHRRQRQPGRVRHGPGRLRADPDVRREPEKHGVRGRVRAVRDRVLRLVRRFRPALRRTSSPARPPIARPTMRTG